MDLTPITTLTFDCYGTLIDWETGILAALSPLLSRHRVALSDDALLELYGELEARAEAGPFRPYREILGAVVRGFGERLGFVPSQAEVESLPESVRHWPAFADTPEALRRLARRFDLVVVSNIDDDLFAGTAPKLGVELTRVITARQVGAYKPSEKVFRHALAELGRPREEILHVAQSLFHDIVPARRLGLATVWVNRRAGKSGAGATPPAAATADLEVPDLESLARLAEAP